MGRRILWGSLALTPLTFIADLLHFGDVALFILAAIALIPLAWLIGEATEHAAHHTGPGIGGFLNATFGNAPELIISLIAISNGLTEVVRGSLTGSVVGNLLLVLGFSLLFGRGDQSVDRESSFIWLGLVLFVDPGFAHSSDPRLARRPGAPRHRRALGPGVVVLLLLYVGVTWWQLRRHRRRHTAPNPPQASGG